MAPLTTAMLQARDIIYECLMVRQGLLITETVARERANNCAQALMELLEPRGNVVAGEIDAPDPYQIAVTYTREPIDEPPPVHAPKSCTKHDWCIDPDGHDGERQIG